MDHCFFLQPLGFRIGAGLTYDRIVWPRGVARRSRPLQAFHTQVVA